MFMPEKPPEPWHSFFRELDAAATADLRLVCIGGFVVTQRYGLARPTADVDYIELVSQEPLTHLVELASFGGELYRRHGIYLSRVAVADYPENYDSRLSEMFLGTYRYLRLFALDPYDLALTKLGRNSPKDRDDVRFLARVTPFDLPLLRSRYREEMRWQVSMPEREDLTLELWIDIINEDRANALGTESQ